MTQYLPFQDTPVPVSRSLGEIAGHLEGAGFGDFIQGKVDGEFTIAAKYGKLTFRWSANVMTIVAALQKQRQRGYLSSDEVKPKAERIAWRIVAAQVKSACDIIKYDVASVTTVFAGNLIGNDGQSFGDRLAHAAVNGELNDFKLLGM